MAEIFSGLGLAALRRLAAVPSVLAFDLDGSLAPIVPNPEDARVPQNTAALLTALSRMWPLAIITGRSIADARQRLGFLPTYLYGNHGAERSSGSMESTWHRRLNPCRKHLIRNRAELASRGIVVEDKGLSLALHYRSSGNAVMASSWLNALVAPVNGSIHTSHGHWVMNITPRHAPDKGDALLEIIQDSRAVQAFMIGDDVNDECAFDKAPPGSVTVRVGPLDIPSGAQFRLPTQGRVDALLTMLLALRR